jgi:mannose-1-phosphate guanylyltransferase / phosphomannomutase
MSSLEQVVVPCGGAGSRLASAVGTLPKLLAPIAGEPLLSHLLRDLEQAGAREIILLAGASGQRVADAARALALPGLSVDTIVEPEPLGTAGALRQIGERLRERFLVVFGDVYTSLDWRRFAQKADENGGLGTLLVHRSSHPEDSDLVALDDAQRLVGWRRRTDRDRSAASLSALTNAAVAVLHRDLLGRIPDRRATDLTADVLPALVDARAPLFGYLSSEYARDIGTPERLAAVDADVRSGRARLRAELALLDRDGVITDGPLALVDRPDRVVLLPKAASAIRRLNAGGVRVAIVTNQAVVARGHCDLATLHAIFDRLRELLAAEGAHVDSIHFCPHHPETHWGAGDPALRGPCRCRKPSIGMVDEALAAHGAPAWRAVVVGDATIDLQLARNAGLPGIAVETGHGARDGRYPAHPSWRFPDLHEAARWLVE